MVLLLGKRAKSLTYAVIGLWVLWGGTRPALAAQDGRLFLGRRTEEALRQAFRDAQIVDLRTCKVPSVVVLREAIGIPPPRIRVRVKVFKRDRIPDVLRPAFGRPGVCGVTIGGRYVAILDTGFRKEYEDILGHELVHAYVTLVAPKPLPFWFQEAGAIMFSTGKVRKFYGKPSASEPRMIVGKMVELDPTYKQKLHSFDYLMKKVGRERFYKWYRKCVLTGEVNPSELLGQTTARENRRVGKPVGIPVWFWFVGLVAVCIVVGLGCYLMRKERSITGRLIS